MKKILLLALPLLFGSVAYADDKLPYAVLGNEYTCDSIINILSSSDPEPARLVIISYVHGYLTAQNMMITIQSKKSPLSFLGSNVSDNFIIEYVRNYCLHNPYSTVPVATMSFSKDLLIEKNH